MVELERYREKREQNAEKFRKVREEYLDMIFDAERKQVQDEYEVTRLPVRGCCRCARWWAVVAGACVLPGESGGHVTLSFVLSSDGRKPCSHALTRALAPRHGDDRAGGAAEAQEQHAGGHPPQA